MQKLPKCYIIYYMNTHHGGKYPMFEKIAEIIADRIGCQRNEIAEDTLIFEELDGDSLDMVEILMAVEDTFGISIPDEEMPNFRTPRDIISYTQNNT